MIKRQKGVFMTKVYTFSTGTVPVLKDWMAKETVGTRIVRIRTQDWYRTRIRGQVQNVDSMATVKVRERRTED